MPNFRYSVISQEGKGAAGVLMASNAMAASQILRAQGNEVTSLELETPWNRLRHAINNALQYSSGPTQKDILSFTTQLAVMIRAGISIRAAIDGIADQVENPKFKAILLEIKRDVESGQPFSEALTQHPKQFSPLYVNMVRASEMTGSFDKMLERIASYIAQQVETRAMVRGAMIYPGVIMTMAILTTVFLLTFVLPKFAMVFEGKESILPWPTTFLMSLSDFMVNHWLVMLLGIAGIIGAFIYYIRTDTGRVWWHKQLLTMPILSRMFSAMYINRSLKTMGELINAGVPMLETITITGEVSGNTLYQRMWGAVHTAVKQGKRISHVLVKSPLLPKSVTQMICAGEESGKLGEVLDEISAFYAKQLRDTIKTVTGLIEPLMIILMGSVVGFIAMAIILPIFKMSSLVK